MPGDRDRRGELRARFGENLKTQREHRGMSQDELAGRMTRRGHGWYQSTVYKTERGEREASFTEANDLADILDCIPDRFLRAPEEVADEWRVLQATATLSQEWGKAADATAVLHHARAAAESVLRKSTASPHETVRRACAGLAADLRHYTPDSAALEGADRWRKIRDGE